MMRSNLYQVENEIEWEAAGEGIKRQVYGYDDRIMLVKVAFEKGAVGQMHQHYHTQVTYVESGAFEMTIGEEKRLIKAGDGYYVPPQVVHGCVCLEPGMLIDVFSPQRE